MVFTPLQGLKQRGRKGIESFIPPVFHTFPHLILPLILCIVDIGQVTEASNLSLFSNTILCLKPLFLAQPSLLRD